MIHRLAWVIASTCMLFASVARAQVHDWEVDNNNSHSTAAVNINNWTFYNIASTVYAKKSADGTAVGSYTTGAQVDSFPQAVQLSDGKWYVFVASEDGSVYKLDVAGGMTIAKTGGVSQIRSLRRPSDTGCLVKDSLTATPSIQLKAFSNAQYNVGRDLVIVPTHHGCSSSSTNMIWALDAADITQPAVWVFNQFGDYVVDYASEGCSIDYNRNYIYCGTNLNTGRYQNTVWSIDTTTGNLVWASNFNSIHARPQLGRAVPEHLYVTDMLGTIHALAPTTGLQDWSLLLNGTAGVYTSQNLWAEWRGDYSGTMYITDSLGHLYSVYDGGTEQGSGQTLWTYTMAGGVKVKSLGSVSPTLGKIYVGADDGTVRQLNLATGAAEGYHAVVGTTAGAAASATVTDPTLYIGQGASDISKLVATAWGTAGVTRQFPVPFSTPTGYGGLNCTMDTDCKSNDNGACGVGTCSLPDSSGGRYCYTKSLTGNTCNDGVACTTGDTCLGGQCVGTWTCAAPNALNCPDARACGQGGVCMPLFTTAGYYCASVLGNVTVGGGAEGGGMSGRGGATGNPDVPCGSFSRTCANATSTGGRGTWGGMRACTNGVCGRALDYCDVSPAIPNLTTYLDERSRPMSSFASDLNFSRVPPANMTSPATCIGYESTYQAATAVSGTTGNVAFANAVGCTVCGGPFICIGTGCAQNNATTNPFTDPLTTGQVATQITVTGRGEAQVAGTSGIAYVYLVGVGGALTYIGTSTFGTSTTATCGACVSPLISVSLTNLAGIPNYYYGNSMEIRVYAYNDTVTTGAWDLVDVDVTVNGQTSTNYVRRSLPSDPSGKPAEYAIVVRSGQLGFMSGVAPILTSALTTVGDIFVSFMNSPGIFDGAGLGLVHTDTESIPQIFPSVAAQPTSCTAGGCAFRLPAYNAGPTAPAWDGITAGLGERFFVGNYVANGDVYKIVRGQTCSTACFASYTAAPIWTGTYPPWCSGGAAPCAPTDRVTAVDFPNPVVETGTSLGDGLLRIAHGTKLEFFAVDSISVAGGPTPHIAYTLDFSTQAAPTDTGGGVPAWPANSITHILSVTADPLNGTNDCYVELRDTNGRNFLAHVRGDDHTVRPTTPYPDTSGVTHPGLLQQMGVPVAGWPQNGFGNDGRLTSSSFSALFRAIPIDPTTAGSGIVSIRSYSLAP